jgi:hypothetical protein
MSKATELTSEGLSASDGLPSLLSGPPEVIIVLF